MYSNKTQIEEWENWLKQQEDYYNRLLEVPPLADRFQWENNLLLKDSTDILDIIDLGDLFSEEKTEEEPQDPQPQELLCYEVFPEDNWEANKENIPPGSKSLSGYHKGGYPPKIKPQKHLKQKNTNYKPLTQNIWYPSNTGTQEEDWGQDTAAGSQSPLQEDWSQDVQESSPLDAVIYRVEVDDTIIKKTRRQKVPRAPGTKGTGDIPVYDRESKKFTRISEYQYYLDQQVHKRYDRNIHNY